MSEIEIIQEDREAAAEYWRELGEPVRAFNARNGGGLLGDGALTHLVAQVRIAARERAIEECAKVADANRHGGVVAYVIASQIRSLNTPPKLKEA